MSGFPPEWFIELDEAPEPEDEQPWDDEVPTWDVRASQTSDDLAVSCAWCGSAYECPPGMLELLLAVLDLSHVCKPDEQQWHQHPEAV